MKIRNRSLRTTVASVSVLALALVGCQDDAATEGEPVDPDAETEETDTDTSTDTDLDEDEDEDESAS